MLVPMTAEQEAEAIEILADLVLELLGGENVDDDRQ